MATDETRSRILQAAGEVFADHGLEKATVRDICRLAEVNLASVNYHFGSKEHLYLEVLRHLHVRRIEANPLPDWPPGTPAEVRLRDFIANFVNSMRSEKSPWEERLMRNEILKPTPAGAEIIEQFVRPHFAKLQELLGELLPDLAEYRRQQLGFTVIGQCAFYKFHEKAMRMLVSGNSLKEHFDSASLTSHIFQVTLAAIRDLQREPAHGAEPQIGNPGGPTSDRRGTRVPDGAGAGDALRMQ